MSQVFVANLSASTDKESLSKFLSFCGSISEIEMQEGHKAVVTFEKPSAASTALMLNGGTLDGSPIHVSSEAVDEDTPSVYGTEHSHDHDDIPQEAKPRTAIVAEYLAHGYVISEPIIQKAVSFDEKHGISSKFLEFFNTLISTSKTKSAELDAQTKISEKAAGAYAQADAKVGINQKAKGAWSTGRRYYEKVLASEFGQQATAFYTSTSNSIKSVHEEAQRIAADKKHASAVANETTATPGATTSTLSSAAETATTPTTSASAPTGTVPTGAVPATSAPRMA